MSTETNPSLLGITTNPDPVPGRYIVVLKDGVEHHDYPYNDVSVWSHALNGFAASLSQAELDELSRSPDVEAIYQDSYVNIASVSDDVPLTAEEINALRPSLDHGALLEGGQDIEQTYTPLTEEELKAIGPVGHEELIIGTEFQTQYNAPWGLQRIRQQQRLTNLQDRQLIFTYTWKDPAGAGVDVYVIDTGIFIRHPEFEGRAFWGATFGGYPNKDDNGHGTHCAGTVGSKQFGVAKKVTLIAVKVLDSKGRGRSSDVISGMNYVAQMAASTGRPSVASMSLGGRVNLAVDNAVLNLTRRGVHVVVAAGNANDDIINHSPARAPTAIAVGATNIYDVRAKFSNYGPTLAFFAPGVNVISTWIPPRYIATLSGTSMACPHASGTLAVLISVYGNDTPAAWKADLILRAVKGVLENIPLGTPNLLLHLEYQKYKAGIYTLPEMDA